MYDLKRFDLKGFRETKLKMTQKELGDRLGLGQDQISRLEKNPESITLEVLLNLCTAAGMTPDQVLAFRLPAPEALAMNDAFKELRVSRNVVNAYLDTRRKQIVSDPDLKASQNFLEQLDAIIRTHTAKPVVAVLGRSDAGKSRFINTLTGMDKLVAEWTPTTTITVYLKHIQDKPKFMKEDEAWVFRAKFGNERDWDFHRFNDPNYCEKWKLAAGGVEVLREFGTRQGGRGLSGEAGSAVVYLDSPILQNCDLVDLPGFGTGDREEDEAQAVRAREHADVIIYLSRANGFLEGVDLQFLKNAIRDLAPVEPFLLDTVKGKRLAPLCNLFIVASQAHTVDKGNEEQLRTILDVQCNRLYKQIPEEFWEDKARVVGIGRAGFTEAALRTRFFTYSLEGAYLRKDLEVALTETLQDLPKLWLSKADKAMQEFRSSVKESLAAELNQVMAILEERESVRQQLAAHEQKRPEHQAKLNLAKAAVIQEIRHLSNSTRTEFQSWFELTLTPERVREIIQKRGYDKKQAQEHLPGNVNDMIYGKVKSLLEGGANKLDKVLTEYLETYRSSTEALSKINFRGTSIPFDFRGAFTASLAGAGVLGGLSLWAAGLGNLGGYILVAKGVSLLSALGISISGGTAAAAAFVSAIGGPITLGIALALGVAALVKWIFGESWESRMAKKMCDQLRENGVMGQYTRNVIDKFWRDTEVGFEDVVRSLDQQFEDHIANMKAMLNTENPELLKVRVRKLEVARDFFAGIPWVVSS